MAGGRGRVQAVLLLLFIIYLPCCVYANDFPREGNRKQESHKWEEQETDRQTLLSTSRARKPGQENNTCSHAQTPLSVL